LAERRSVPAPLAQVVREGKLREIPGVGDAIADIITGCIKPAPIRD
jgi:hypothetical protein